MEVKIGDIVCEDGHRCTVAEVFPPDAEGFDTLIYCHQCHEEMKAKSSRFTPYIESEEDVDI